MKDKGGRIGSSHDDYLKEEGIYEEVTARAIKRVLVRQLDALMRDKGLTKTELAKRMHTSRAQLDRLLDPENKSVTLASLRAAARWRKLAESARANPTYGEATARSAAMPGSSRPSSHSRNAPPAVDT